MIQRLIKAAFRKKKVNPFAEMDLNKSIDEYKIAQEPVFISGNGRSGTHFMAKVLEQHEQFNSMHHDDIPDTIADVYTWFSTWYGIPISPNGFLKSRAHLIEQAGKLGKRYVESNAILCLNVHQLLAAFGGKLIIMVRHPKNVTESHFHKGWYKKVDYNNALPVPGYNFYHDRSSHFFSRIMPKNELEFEAWKNYTRMGKCAWKWRICYEELFKQIEQYQLKDKVRFIYLNNFDYTAYLSLCEWIGISNVMPEATYNQIVSDKPGKGKVKPDTHQWSNDEKRDFNIEIQKVIDKFQMIDDRQKWIFKDL